MLVFVVVVSIIAAGISRYAGTNLRYSTVVRDRAAASAAAEAGVRYAIDRVTTNSVTSCDGGPVRIAPSHGRLYDDVTPTITCERLGGGAPTLGGWAAVITGEGIGSQEGLRIDDEGINAATGRIFVESADDDGIRVGGSGPVRFREADVFYDGSADDCATIEEYGNGSYDDYDLDADHALVCWPQPWTDVVEEPPYEVADLLALPVDPMWTMSGSCRVFEPGRYQSLDVLSGGHNYFRSGPYVFEDADVDTAPGANGTYILGGYPHDSRFANRLITSGPCMAAQAADGLDGGPNGVTWYLGGSTEVEIRRSTTMELLPLVQTSGGREYAVSVHVLGPGSPWPETLDDRDQVIDDKGSSPDNTLLFQGQIWAPTLVVDLEDSHGDANGQLTSGVVAAQVLIESDPGTVGTLGPDITSVDHRLLLTSTATVGGVTVEARAVVDHRPSAAIGDRVAVRSIRFDD